MASLPPIENPPRNGRICADSVPVRHRSLTRAVPLPGEELDVRFDYLLRLGDDGLILGQRLEWWARRRSRSTSASPTWAST